jgi:simple sugar transport system substrate-binding protein
LEKDVVGDDAWKGKINFYIEGVEGKVPSGK